MLYEYKLLIIIIFKNLGRNFPDQLLSGYLQDYINDTTEIIQHINIPNHKTHPRS